MPASFSSTSSSLTSFVAAVEHFVDAYLAGEVEPAIKSEPLPPPSSSALVKVVGLTYDSIINDPNRDVLLTVCIEKCGPCERLYPVLEDLAEAYRVEEAEDGERKGGKEEGQKNTTVATVMYDQNDTGVRGVRAFPTILMFPAGKVSL